MTALSLFDLATLAAQTQEPLSSLGREAAMRLMKVAESMVTSAVEQFEKVEELDIAFAGSSEASSTQVFDIEAAVVIRAMYDECIREAERVLPRIDRLEGQGHSVAGANMLRTWFRRTKAMLSVPLDEISKSLEDVKQGKTISGADVRNELLTRLHR